MTGLVAAGGVTVAARSLLRHSVATWGLLRRRIAVSKLHWLSWRWLGLVLAVTHLHRGLNGSRSRLAVAHLQMLLGRGSGNSRRAIACLITGSRLSVTHLQGLLSRGGGRVGAVAHRSGRGSSG